MVVGTIIGASIFVQPSEITGQIPSVAGALGVWLVSGVLTLIGALVCAELASLHPQAGGVYVFLRESFGRPVGFLWGWAMLWSMHSGILAAIAMVFGRYTAYFVPLGDVGVKLVGVAAIGVLTVVNYLGARPGTLLQTSFTAGKLIAIALIIVVGVSLGTRLPAHFVGTAAPDATATTSDYLIALVAGLFAFGGWHMVTYNAEETHDARQTIPRALMIGVAVVTCCYMAMNAVYMYILPLDEVAQSTRVAADAADVVLGFGGGATMSAIVMFSTFGALSGIVMAGPRVYYAMARDGMFFGWFGAVHPAYRTPHRAIVLQGVWAAGLVLTGTFRALFTRVVYTEWIFFSLLAVAVVMGRRRPVPPSGYRMPGFPILPALFILASWTIVANQLATDPLDSLVGLGFVLAGLPVYYLWSRFTRGRRSA